MILYENEPFPQNKKEQRKGNDSMDKKKENSVVQGTEFEGRDEVYLDIDRIINEGLSGGSVHARGATTNIEEARDLSEETPPYECD
jgi:hypothetical protein